MTAYFIGGDERGVSCSEEARKVARRLVKANRQLGVTVLFSAASFLLRDGQQPRDSAVVAEARRRSAHVERAVEARERHMRERRERDPDASALDQIREGAPA